MSACWIKDKIRPICCFGSRSCAEEKTAFVVLKKSMFANAVAVFNFGNSLEEMFAKSHKEEQSKQTTAHFACILSLCSCQPSIRGENWVI